MQNIDFSRFSAEVRRSIESAARYASSFNSSMIMPCHLMAGLVAVNNMAVYTALQRGGFDPDASLELIAQGMSAVSRTYGSTGLTFHPAVEDAFAMAVAEPGEVSVTRLVKAMTEGDAQGLAPYLVLAEVLDVDDTDDGERQEVEPRDYEVDGIAAGKTIRKFCVNMLELAAKGKYHHAIGREDELSRILLILARSTKNNPVLVGEPGTGKTAIAEELAIRLLNRQVPPALRSLKLYSLEYSSIKSLQDPVGVMKSILEEAAADPDLVLFIDETHMLVSNNAYSDNDIANLLKPTMARGEIKILGATTPDEYKRIEKDSAFERRFQMVMVDEPDIESAIKIVVGTKDTFERYHQVTIPESVCKAAVTLSARYITTRKLPDKAFDLLDLASADLRLHGGRRQTLEENDVKRIITSWTGIPVDELDNDETQRLQHIEQDLHAQVVGQDKAIKAVADAIRRSRMGLGDPARPIGSFLFLGTTGTGKTELCKAIAKFLFHDSEAMVRIDMSEYQQEHSSHRLFGAPPGYVGYEDAGQLTEAVYRKPFSVILFDEIEKAHPKVMETLLQILDDGRMTDGKGKVVNFKNTLIVMTSNLGQQQILASLLTPHVSDMDVERCTAQVMQQLQRTVKPEFINRIDTIVMFLPLTKDEITEIARLNLDKEQAKLHDKGMTVSIAPEVIDFIVSKGYVPEYGGRPVKRAITENVLNPLTSAIVNGTIDKSLPIHISINNDHVVFTNGPASGIRPEQDGICEIGPED